MRRLAMASARCGLKRIVRDVDDIVHEAHGHRGDGAKGGVIETRLGGEWIRHEAARD